jgi:hypothetical protein
LNDPAIIFTSVLQDQIVAVHDDHFADQTLGLVEAFFPRDVKRRMTKRWTDDTDFDRRLSVGLRETAEGNTGAEQENDGSECVSHPACAFHRSMA